MPFQQNIDNTRAERIGEHGVAKAALDGTLRRCEAALDWLRQQHADETLPLLRLPAKTSDLDEINRAAARLRAGATDVVVLGTGGSSLGGQTIAQLADIGVRGAEAFRCSPAHALHGQSRSRDLRRAARETSARDHALHRDLEIRRHRRDADADRGRAQRCETGRPRGAHRRIVLRHQRRPRSPARTMACAICSVHRSRCSNTIRTSADAIRA